MIVFNKVQHKEDCSLVKHLVSSLETSAEASCPCLNENNVASLCDDFYKKVVTDPCVDDILMLLAINAPASVISEARQALLKAVSLDSIKIEMFIKFTSATGVSRNFFQAVREKATSFILKHEFDYSLSYMTTERLKTWEEVWLSTGSFSEARSALLKSEIEFTNSSSALQSFLTAQYSATLFEDMVKSILAACFEGEYVVLAFFKWRAFVAKLKLEDSALFKGALAVFETVSYKEDLLLRVPRSLASDLYFMFDYDDYAPRKVSELGVLAASDFSSKAAPAYEVALNLFAAAGGSLNSTRASRRGSPDSLDVSLSSFWNTALLLLKEQK